MIVRAFHSGVRFQSPVAPVLLAVTAALICAASPSAMAQTRTNNTKPDQAPAAETRTPAMPNGRFRGTQEPADDSAQAGDEESESAPQTDARGAIVTRPANAFPLTRRPAQPSPATMGADPADDPDADPDVADGAERLANRRPQDGDLNVAEPQPVRDGEVALEPPPVQADGDLALAEDIVAGEAELEESLREQERLGRPITPRRYGPYQPAGVRVGSFLLFPTIDAGMSSSDNVFRSATNRKSDMFADIATGGVLSSNWNRHALELRVQGTRTFHDRYQSEDDRRIDAQARGRLDISRRSNLTGDVSYTYGQEARGGVNTPTSALGARPDVITRRAAIEANHRFNRLTLQLRGAVTDNVYATVPLTDPVTGLPAMPSDSGNERNYVQREVGARAGWQFSPNLTLYADSVLNNRRHEAPGTADGILRNSDGYRLQGGVAVNALGKLQGEASAGYASQTPEDRRLKTASGFIYNGRMSWQPTGLTEVVLEAKSDIGETTAAGSGGALTKTSSIEVRHALRRHLILVAGASYSVANYGGSSIRESSTIEKLGIEYYLSRELALLAGYQHTSFETNSGDGKYEDNTVRVGLRVRR